MRKSASNYSGFTLLELLVTIGMIAMLVAVGVPVLSDWTQRAEVRGETQRYVGIMNLARSTAVTTNQVVTIAISDADAEGRIDVDVFTDGGGEGNQAFAGNPPDQYLRRFEGEASSLALTMIPDVDFISFDERGRLMGGQVLRVDIANDNASLGRVIDINLVGRAMVSEKDFE